MFVARQTRPAHHLPKHWNRINFPLNLLRKHFFAPRSLPHPNAPAMTWRRRHAIFLLLFPDFNIINGIPPWFFFPLPLFQLETRSRRHGAFANRTRRKYLSPRRFFQATNLEKHRRERHHAEENEDRTVPLPRLSWPTAAIRTHPAAGTRLENVKTSIIVSYVFHSRLQSLDFRQRLRRSHS